MAKSFIGKMHIFSPDNMISTTEISNYISSNSKKHVKNVLDKYSSIKNSVGQTTFSNKSIELLSENATTILSTTIDLSTSINENQNENSNLKYLFIPLGIVFTVFILTGLVFLLARKRKLDNLRHRLMPQYTFDPSEEYENEWETELLDETYDKKNKFQGYKTMDFRKL